MNVVLLTPPEHRWVCLSCDLKEVTHEQRPHTRMHACAELGGLTFPMVLEGTRGENRVVEREDYIGSEVVRLHGGRPVMNVTTVRDDGIDCTVFAPTATAKVEA